MKENYIAIGDITGRYDLLSLLLRKVGEQPEFCDASIDLTGYKFVFLGDMIDRGPDSFLVVDRIKTMCEIGSAIALLGNHEDMMLDYYRQRIVNKQSIWLANGGHKTIESYTRAMKLYGQARFFEALNKSGHAAWLKTLPYFYETDKIWFSHAPIPQARFRTMKTGDFRADVHALTWSYMADEDEGSWEHDHGKLAVCGHIHALFEGNLLPRIFPHIVYADTGSGCADHAPLTAIFIEGGKFKKYVQAYPAELLDRKFDAPV